MIELNLSNSMSYSTCPSTSVWFIVSSFVTHNENILSLGKDTCIYAFSNDGCERNLLKFILYGTQHLYHLLLPLTVYTYIQLWFRSTLKC